MGALVGWLGTTLGALGTLLALATLPTTWVEHHPTAYVLLWAVAVGSMVIVMLMPAWYGSRWASFRWRVWLAARSFGSKPPTVLPYSVWPMYPTGERKFVFETDRRQRRAVFTPSRPAGLHITKPFEANVWEGSLPVNVQRHGKTIFRVVEFMPRGIASGFVIADQSPGIVVEGEVSYTEYASMLFAEARSHGAKKPVHPARVRRKRRRGASPP